MPRLHRLRSLTGIASRHRVQVLCGSTGIGIRTASGIAGAMATGHDHPIAEPRGAPRGIGAVAGIRGSGVAE